MLYTGSSVLDTMDACCTRHLLSLVILSLHSVPSCQFLPRFNKYSFSTLYVSFCLLYSIAIFCFCLFAIFNRVSFLNHYICMFNTYS